MSVTFVHSRETIKTNIVIAILGLILLYSTQGFTWNALGHRLIAKIAYNQLTPKAKCTFNRYNRAVNKSFTPQNWVNAAVWLDTIRYQKIEKYNSMHYVDWYYSEDGTSLPPFNQINAISGINQSMDTLKEPSANNLNKGLALRVILHVVGDIHQPMHTISQVSREYPEGDRGGNLVILSKNSIAKNLHSYWDNGGGYLKLKTPKKRNPSIKKMAAQLEHEYPCSSLSLTIAPTEWAKESHELGIKAYQLLYHNIPYHYYQITTINIVKKQIALAGCRLGALLNAIAERESLATHS